MKKQNVHEHTQTGKDFLECECRGVCCRMSPFFMRPRRKQPRPEALCLFELFIHIPVSFMGSGPNAHSD